MATTEPGSVMSDRSRGLASCIFDVDGLLLASPHEQAWREALAGFADPECFTTEMYQAHVAGKPRLSGALAALQALGVPDARQQRAGLRRNQTAAPGGVDRCRGSPSLSRRTALRSGRRGAALAPGGRVVLQERQRNDAADPTRTGEKSARRRSRSTSVVARSGRASQTRRFSCSPRPNSGSRPHVAWWWRTPPPAFRRPVRVAWRHSGWRGNTMPTCFGRRRLIWW